ncbi:uncharacterized protein ACBT44_002870 isoform 1-T1 [Syngnathus typhle]
MGWSPLVVLVITALLSMRTRQQMQVQHMQVQPTDQSVLEQTAVQNLSEASTGRYDATVWGADTPEAGKERESLSEEQLIRVHDELDKETFIAENDESFQEVEDSEPLGAACRVDDLAELSAAVCTSPFEQQMASLEEDARCVLDRVIGAYNQLSVCLESLSHWCGCYYPNGAVHTAFLRVHSAFFGRCRPRAPERQPEDAPRLLVLCLTLAPVALVPLLVSAAAARCRPMTAGSQ